MAHPLQEGLNALEPATWAAPIRGGVEGVEQASAVSQAISAKRQADALERIAGALDGQGRGATLHSFIGHAADALRNMDRGG